MIEIYAQKKQSLALGYQGENNARRVVFDIADWVDTFGEGIPRLLVQREGDRQPYPCTVTQDGTLVNWTISAADVASPGRGQCELAYLVGEQVVKSRTWRTVTQTALGDPGETPSRPMESWVNQMTRTVQAAEEAAKQAANAVSEGISIGDNGNWHIGGQDSGVTATGPQGEKGEPGEKGEQGEKGDTGPQGEKGDTGAVGPQGPQGIQGPRGLQGATGATGAQGPAGADGADGKSAYDYAQEGGYTGTLEEFITTLSGKLFVPEYWSSHLEEKIAAIKALQEEGGKDCFSFVVITDPHYESNLGKRAPTLARLIMDECGIKYCLCLGDSQTRHGANHDTDYILNEWDEIEAMFRPLRDRLLMQLGNHDGSYGILDANGDGTADDINGDGVVSANDKCVYNLTPRQLYQRVFRKVGLIPGVIFDDSGNAFYVDDQSAKVRYILLNSHCNEYQENEDGTAVNNNMTHFRFGQAQYDFLINDALSTVPEGWSVIVGCHVPLDRTQEYIYWGGEINDSGSLADGSVADCTVMQRLLNAYHQKTTYSGSFGGAATDTGDEGGTGGGESGGDTPPASYTNLADTGSSDWAANSRFDSSGNVAANSGTVVTNYIPCALGDTIRLKNATLASGQRMAFYDSDKAYISILSLSPLTSGGCISTDETTGVQTLVNVGATAPDGTPLEALANTAYVRLVITVEDGAAPIITVNEELTEEAAAALSAAAETDAAAGYDYVSVNADFTNAKGELIGLFAGHVHADFYWRPGLIYNDWEDSKFGIITTRCDARTENTSDLMAQRVAGTVTEQSFDVFTVNRATRTITATKIGAGDDRVISY